MSGSFAVRGAPVLGAERITAAGRRPRALERLRGTRATTVSPAQDWPDGPEQALADAVSETSPGLVPDCLWGLDTEPAFAALGRDGEDTEDTEANTAYV